MSGISVATIKSPEFVNITSINPLISKCEIKVLYVGQNRNRSAISKEVASNMAQTLPGTPIVGYYSENEEDFRDHGDQMVIDGDGIKLNCLTKPYGFVPLETKVWFKEFEDTDEFGNKELREYLMCEGYLWTEQYKEAQKVLNEGRPHSMELDESSLKGHWSTDNNRGIDFFIITDATFTKLCILGNDVEPCFEGSSVTSPDISASFTKDNDKFVKTLYSMMQEFKEFTYSLNKGGNSMEEKQAVEIQPSAEQQFSETSAEGANVETSASEPIAAPEENFSNSEDKNISENMAENQNITEEFKKNDDEEEKENKNDSSNNSDSNSKSDDETDEDTEEDEKKKAKNTLEEKYALLETEFNELQEKYTSLEAQNKELIEFKANIEDKEKDEMIKSFYMLSDEDKKDVIENKSKFTLEEIEKELSVICVRKKVNFNLDEEKKEESPAVTFSLDGAGDDPLPAWLKAVEARKNAE